MVKEGRSDKPPESEGSPSFPTSISLPKGGGAIRGIGEKFAANPVTGTGSLSVPIAVSPGRSGFGPQLSLNYDSGAGNGPFGLGWNLSLPSITRKTDKGLPRYFDAVDSDVFILSDAEDLVPVFKKKNDGEWEIDGNGCHMIDEVDRDGYKVRRYRPRIEGMFARIERWCNQSDPEDVYWRSISKDNITTWYGKTENSRIFDPEDKNRIFSWLICQSYDDKGNAIIYKYTEENSERIFEDPDGNLVTKAHERNNNDNSRSANRYIKHIKYGNRTPNRDENWVAIDPAGINDWMFEVLFDYGEGHYSEKTPDAQRKIFANAQIKPPDGSYWPARQDPFSTYRTGFEIRTYRLCQRALMFHHFPNELGTDDYLVRSTDFTYSDEQDTGNSRNPVYTFLKGVTQSSYKYNGNSYLKRSMPPVEFEYTQPVVQDTVADVDPESLENLPIGVDGSTCQWTDLHGEGIPGILTEQADGWFYKRNLSPIARQPDKRGLVEFGPLEDVALKPNLSLNEGAQFMDLAGDGQPDLVVLDGSITGLYEHDSKEGWQPFRPFTSRLNRNTRDPNLKFVDLDGDGHADVLITEDDAFIWHRSLAEEGFGPAQRVQQTLDEEKGPRLVFADGTQSIHLADLSGDGLSDLVRIRNGEVCYWPNLGYCRFGAKVTMDNAPWFNASDQFDHKRIRLADIDGSGTTDIIYLHPDGVSLYFNQSGNSWSQEKVLKVFPRIDDLVNIAVTDLLGNGTACLVWSSPLPGHSQKPMRYINLMGEQKPHLLVTTRNNLGAETKVRYAPSTKFYLRDKYDGNPWITRLPFPVHVVERVETYDWISRNRFVTRYAYHHGYFDGVEREFRGFGMVEQWDTEEIGKLKQNEIDSRDDNLREESFIPPVLTKTWFHTGAFQDRKHISDFFAGIGKDAGEYFREPGLTDPEAKALLLPDTTLPAGLSVEEKREACRALKGSMLRQEVYGLDGTNKEEHPYTVTEQNFTIEHLQPRDDNRHAIFFTHPREAISYHYERNPADPRIQHTLTLEVDGYGNALKEIAIGYGRRPNKSPLTGEDKEKQEKILITYSKNDVTKEIDTDDTYRVPLPAEVRTYELTGIDPENNADRFSFDEWTRNNFALVSGAAVISYEENAGHTVPEKRLIEHLRTYYRPDDLGTAQNDPHALLPLGTIESLALPGESYTLAFTPGLLNKVFKRNNQPLIPDAALVLGAKGADGGGYVDLDGDGAWWIPSGRVFLSSNTADSPAAELAEAQTHFFLPCRFRNPFGKSATVTYDNHNLLMKQTADPLNNTVTAENNYRVLQPRLVTDPNHNRSAVAFDAVGMVVGTAVMGKPAPAPVEGDLLDGFTTDLTQAEIDQFLSNPKGPMAATLLGDATTRVIYDLNRFQHSQKDHPNESDNWQPVYASTLARETHVSDLDGNNSKIQINFSYSDGFSREIQKKIQAEKGPVHQRDADGKIIVGADGQPWMTPNDVSPRWVGSGWTIFNNKGKPVRQYEPFFSDTHRFEFEVKIGVSPVLFYDPLERVVATLHPNHTWEKVVFNPWRQTSWDVNDTVLLDAATDPDVGDFFRRLPKADYLPTWHTLRTDPVHAAAFTARYPDVKDRTNEASAAAKAAAHAGTKTMAHFDTLGRTFLTTAHNKVVCPGHERHGKEENLHTRVELDIEGNQRAVRDAVKKAFDAQGNKVEDPLGRIVMRYDYDMAGPEESEDEDDGGAQKPIHQASMEAGERWALYDVAGNPVRAWDSLGFARRITYDELRRPTGLFVTESGAERLAEKTVYGENQGDALNHRGQVYQQFDQAGGVTSDAYDFKGNLLQSRRRLQPEYKQAIDWKTTQPSGEVFQSTTTYDALNRPIQLIAPHSDQPGTKVNVIRPGYNEANLLERMVAWLNQDAAPGDLLDPTTANLYAVTNIDYDAKGQRMRIDYGNRTSTFYQYDPLTFSLVHLLTRRNAADFPNDCPEPPPVGWPGCQIQNLHYTYDPAGNITHIRDEAQQTIFFKNRRVEPNAEYTYDALYRLIEATGREHLGQNNKPAPHSYDDAPRVNLSHPGDGRAMGTYTERYIYDEVGNFLEMRHRGDDPQNPGWTRTYKYDETSLLEGNKKSNRLSSTKVGNGINSPLEQYSYDAHGNMLKMSHLPQMDWDFEDQLQQVDLGGGGTAYYVYDAGGERVRKVIERQNGTRKGERIYLGGFEIYREYNGNGNTVTLERETLHIMDDQQRIALVETRTKGDDGTAAKLIRYQLGNHLGSASVELNEKAQVITYEEHSPYGSTVYQAVDKNMKAAAKRYRYTGKERDEETGLNYHGARYYAAWLGRWVSCDPSALIDGPNVYGYVLNNPLRFQDDDGRSHNYPLHGGKVVTAHDKSTLHTMYRRASSQRNVRRVYIGGKWRLTGGPIVKGKQEIRIGNIYRFPRSHRPQKLLKDSKARLIREGCQQPGYRAMYTAATGRLIVSSKYGQRLKRFIDRELASGKPIKNRRFFVKLQWRLNNQKSISGKKVVQSLFLGYAGIEKTIRALRTTGTDKPVFDQYRIKQISLKRGASDIAFNHLLNEVKRSSFGIGVMSLLTRRNGRLIRGRGNHAFSYDTRDIINGKHGVAAEVHYSKGPGDKDLFEFLDIDTWFNKRRPESPITIWAFTKK